MERHFTIIGSEKMIHLSNNEYQAVLKTNFFGKFLQIHVKNKWYYVVAYEKNNSYAPISELFRHLDDLKGKRIFYTEKRLKKKDIEKLNKLPAVLFEYKKEHGAITARKKAMKELNLEIPELKESLHVHKVIQH